MAYLNASLILWPQVPGLCKKVKTGGSNGRLCCPCLFKKSHQIGVKGNHYCSFAQYIDYRYKLEPPGK